MPLYKIPLKNDAVNFSTTIDINNREYFFRFTWNKRENLYLMDIGNSENDIFDAGIPLLVGVQLNARCLDFINGILMLSSTDNSDKATLENLGSSFEMWFNDLR